VDRDAVVVERRVHQRKRAQRFDDGVHEERQQRELDAVLAFECVALREAPFPKRGDVDLDHRPRVRRGVLRLDHPARDQLARRRERQQFAERDRERAPVARVGAAPRLRSG
jgi:hypothetical protein